MKKITASSRKVFNVCVVGNYLQSTASRQRMLLTDALIRLARAAERKGSQVRVLVNKVDPAAALALRTCNALSLPAESIVGKQMAELLQDEHNSYLLLLTVKGTNIQSEDGQALTAGLEDYVQQAKDLLSPACESKELVSTVTDKDISPDQKHAIPVSDTPFTKQVFDRTGDYGDFSAYIDEWFEGVRRVDPIPHHDLNSEPPHGDVNTKLAADHTRN